MLPFEPTKYDVIYADPPWKQTKGGLRKARPNQGKSLDYPVIGIDEIRAHLNACPKSDSRG